MIALEHASPAEVAFQVLGGYPVKAPVMVIRQETSGRNNSGLPESLAPCTAMTLLPRSLPMAIMTMISPFDWPTHILVVLMTGLKSGFYE